MKSLPEWLAAYFKYRQYKWKILGGELIVPSQEDIEEALDQIEKTLYNEGVGSIMEVGRLIAIRQEEGVDIYVHVGTYPEGDENVN